LADRVIVVGATRGRQKVPASEISQMIGRVGREHSGSECVATIIVDESNAQELVADMENKDSHFVGSTLADKQIVAFHILPEICTGSVQNVEDARQWYTRSLGALQKEKPPFEKAFGLLESVRAIRFLNEGAVATDLGKIASRFYFHPSDVSAWMDSFTKVFELGLECDDFAVAWALACAPTMRASGDFGKHWEVVQRYKDSLPPGLDSSKSGVVTGTLWWHILGGPPVGKMRSQSLSLKRDAGRIMNAMKELDARVANWKMIDFFDDLAWRVRRSIPSSLASLCKLPGITKSKALYLRSEGIIDKEGIKTAISQLKQDVDESFYKILKRIADGVC